MPDPFTALLAPMHVEEFRREWFLLHPHHATGDAERIAAFPRSSELRPLLREASCVRAVFAELRQAKIAPEDAEDLFLSGATICITAAHRGSPFLTELVRCARAALAYTAPISVRAYWSPAGAGFDVHFDRRGVTTIQVEGTKRWWYSAAPSEPFPLDNVSAPLTASQQASLDEADIRSVLLAPGDILCLPPGTWHWAKGESASLAYNLAFDYLDGSVADLLTRALRTELLCSPQLRMPLHGDLERPEATVARVREACVAASEALLEASRRPDLMLRLWRRAVRDDG